MYNKILASFKTSYLCHLQALHLPNKVSIKFKQTLKNKIFVPDSLSALTDLKLLINE